MDAELPSRADRGAVYGLFTTLPALPDVRGRALLAAVAFILTFGGFVVAVVLEIPDVFARAGNLVALAGAAFAYYGPCKLEAVDRWIEESKSTIDLESELTWDRYGEDPGVQAAQRPAAIPVNLLRYLASVGGIDLPAQGEGATQLDYWNVLQALAQSRTSRDGLVNDLNASLHSAEFRVAAFGVVLSTVGDWALKPFVAPLLSLAKRLWECLV